MIFRIIKALTSAAGGSRRRRRVPTRRQIKRHQRRNYGRKY